MADHVNRKEVCSNTIFVNSPVDFPRETASEESCGWSASASDGFSLSDSRSNRRETVGFESGGGGDDGRENSWMPIVDEADEGAPVLLEDQPSFAETPRAPSFVSNDEFRRAAYEGQVRRWQQEETEYLHHEGWCEFRLIILLQEAFRCSLQNLKAAHHRGEMPTDVFAARVKALKEAMKHVKREYRRTLQCTRERKGSLPSIASKAVTCVASVYPWSSHGFVMGFEENLSFGELTESADSGHRRATSLTSLAWAPLAKSGGVASADAQLSLNAPSAEAYPNQRMECAERDVGALVSGVGRRPVKPAVALRPLPPRRQLFQKRAMPNGSLLLSLAPESSSAGCAPNTRGPVPLMGSSRSSFVMSPCTGTPTSPFLVPAPAIAGPIRYDEFRFLEKRQLIVQGQALVSRSLASTPFIARRRATVAAATMRRRLKPVRNRIESAADVPSSRSPLLSRPVSLPLSPPVGTHGTFPDLNLIAWTGAQEPVPPSYPCPPHQDVTRGSSRLPIPQNVPFYAPPNSRTQSKTPLTTHNHMGAAIREAAWASSKRHFPRDSDANGGRSPLAMRLGCAAHLPTMIAISIEDEKCVKELW